MKRTKRSRTRCYVLREIDIKHHGRMVNVKRGNRSNSNSHTIRAEDGSILTDLGDIRKDWENYLEKLATPSQGSKYGRDFKRHVEESLAVFVMKSYTTLNNVVEKDRRTR